MTQTGYANAVVNVMLGWLKGLANWVLKLFNLAGSGGNPLLWLSENWLKLLILLLVAGVAIDWLVWMIRWRPYWVWFKKKRIIVNDERFLKGEELDEEDYEAMMEKEYVVPSTVVKRRKGEGRPAQTATVQRAPQRRTRIAPTSATKRPARKTISRDEMNDDLFEVGHDQEDYSDFYEDEVFNVSSLPDMQETRKPRKRRK